MVVTLRSASRDDAAAFRVVQPALPEDVLAKPLDWRVYRPVRVILSTDGWKWLIESFSLSAGCVFYFWFYRPSDVGWSIDLAS